MLFFKFEIKSISTKVNVANISAITFVSIKITLKTLLKQVVVGSLVNSHQLILKTKTYTLFN